VIREARGAILAASCRILERFDPDVICLGGGVLTVLPCLADGLGDRIRDSCARSRGRQPTILDIARLGDDAGTAGAALLAMQHR
jgi:hypothetical protein